MKREWIWGTWGIAVVTAILVIIGGHSAWARVPAAPAAGSVRAPAATLVVTSTADSGPGTLRWALQTAVAGDTITFSPTIFPPASPVTITLSSGPLPEITQGDLTIDASNAGVVLDGSAPSSGNGFHITSDGNVIKGLQILYFPARGVFISDGAQYNTVGGDSEEERNVISGNGFTQVDIEGTGTDHNVVSGNYIGTDVSGLQALGGGYGVRIEFGARYNMLGGTTPGERNLISGNGTTGVVVNRSGTMSNTIVGNLIGTDATGTAALGNDGDGVGFSLDSKYNRVESNVISGNHGNGVWICDSGTMYNVISSNYIGTDASGAVALGNAGDGVYIGGGPIHNLIGGSNATPGGACTGDCNLISGNGDSGVFIEGNGTISNTVSGNYIGTNSTGTAALPNRHDGVWVSGGARHNVIGPDNLISGNGDFGRTQVRIEGVGTHYNLVIGNHIGTDRSGLQGLGGGYGVRIEFGARYNVLGGTTPDERNLISGNGMTGVVVNQSGTMSNTVVGNLIGTDATGTAALGNDGDGVGFGLGSQYNRVESNVISGNHGNGMWICDNGTMYNVIRGNYIGTDVNGTSAVSNSENGVNISGGASHNLIGGSNATSGGACAGDCNLISGNGDDGVRIEGSDAMTNTVSGNYIGIDATGTLPLGNSGDGIRMETGARYNVIGGNSPGERNVVSGNGSSGISIGGGATENVVIGNYIGTDVSGMAPAGNSQAGNHAGVAIYSGATRNRIERNGISGNNAVGVSVNWGLDSDNNVSIGDYIGTDATGTRALGNTLAGVYMADDASDNIIGGSTPAEGNIIAYNGVFGVFIRGTATIRNTITHNSIHSNAYIGIDLSDGGNTELDAPIITHVDAGTVTGMACPGCTVEVFSDVEDEGRLYEGSTTANSLGVFVFTRAGGLIGPYVTATATNRDGNTSEFSSPHKAWARICLPVILKSKL